MIKAVIYARYSCDNQREESIEGQLRECKEFAIRKGYTLVGSYIDRAMSAKTDNRPEFQRMIKESAKELFDVVIVWKLDRFARNRYDSAHYKATLRRNGVKVVSATEVISEGAVKRPPRYGQKRLFEIKTVDKSQKKWYNIHALSIRRIRQRWRAT